LGRARVRVSACGATLGMMMRTGEKIRYAKMAIASHLLRLSLRLRRRRRGRRRRRFRRRLRLGLRRRFKIRLVHCCGTAARATCRQWQS